MGDDLMKRMAVELNEGDIGGMLFRLEKRFINLEKIFKRS